MGRVDHAVQLFADGMSCSQAVFVPFALTLGVDASEALKLAAGFGGGMRIGGTCGAATGAVLALGLGFAGDDDPERRERVSRAVESFYARFVDEVGATECPVILGNDPRSEEGRTAIREQGLRETRCLPAVRAAASILEDMFGVPDPSSRPTR